MEKLTFDDCAKVLGLIDVTIFELSKNDDDYSKKRIDELNYLHNKLFSILKELHKKKNCIKKRNSI